MIKNKQVVLLTWPSTSGKTTIQNILLDRWWERPNNFTTRDKRSERELDEYIFLKKDRFQFLKDKDTFLETVNYWDNFYGVSRTLPNSELITIIVDPIWRDQIMQKFANWELTDVENILCVFIDIWEDEQYRRLNWRRESIMEINKRKRDLAWFSPTRESLVINWELGTKILVKQIEEWIKSLKKT